MTEVVVPPAVTVKPNSGHNPTALAYALKGQMNSVNMAATPLAFSTLDGVKKTVKDFKNEIFMGMEWEHRSNTADLAANIKRAAEGPLWDYVNYGTGGAPCEMRTIPATLGYHQKILETEFFDKGFDKGIETGDNGLGIHIHIDRRAFTETTIKKFCGFLALPDNKKFCQDIGGRVWPCAGGGVPQVALKFFTSPKFKNKLRGVGTSFGDAVYNPNISGKGVIVNTGTGHGTVEFRMFRTVNTKQKLLKNLEFTDALIRFCRVKAYNQLTSKEFVKFVALKKEAYPNLFVDAVIQNELKRKVS